MSTLSFVLFSISNTDPTCNAIKHLYQTVQPDGKSCCDGTLQYGDLTCTSSSIDYGALGVLSRETASHIEAHGGWEIDDLVDRRVLTRAPYSIEEAYHINTNSMFIVSRNRNSSVGGVKAGATSKAIQDAFDLSEAHFGIMPLDSFIPHVSGGITLQRESFFHVPKFEVEIGYRLKEVNLTMAPFTSETVKPFLKTLAPVFEIQDSTPWTYSANRLIALCLSNLFYKHTVVGTEQPWTDAAQSVVDATSVTITENGVQRGDVLLGTAVYPSFLWVIAQIFNHAATYNIPLHEDMFIITGSIGSSMTITPNVPTSAAFLGLETLSFTLQETA